MLAAYGLSLGLITTNFDLSPPRHLPSIHPCARYFPTFDEFSAIAATGAKIIPVYRQLLADRLTPVTAFEVLGREQHAFLLESVIGGEKIGRYSFIAAGPQTVYQVAGGHASICRSFGQAAREFTTTDPLADLQKLLPPSHYHHDKQSPRLHRRPGRLRRLRHHPLLRSRKTPRPPQRRPQNSRPALRPLRRTGRSSTTSTKPSKSSPTPRSGPRPTSKPPIAMPAGGSTTSSPASSSRRPFALGEIDPHRAR